MATAKRDGFYKRGRVWWVRTDPVTGKARTTKCTDIEAARLWRRARERAAADPASAAAEEAELGPWTDRYLALKERTRSEATAGIIEQKLKQVLRVFGRACKLSTIDTAKCDAYVMTRRGEGISDMSISKEWQCLAASLKLAKRAGCFARDLETLRPVDLHATYVPRKRALSRPEVVALLSELKPTHAALVAVCVALGCRLSEALRLLPSDVDMERGRVFIRGRKTKGSERWVPVLSVYRSLLEQALPYLPLTVPLGTVHTTILDACRRAKIDRCSPNDFRRTHVTLLAEAGVDRDVTRRLLGHTTTKLVDTVYSQPRTEALSELAERHLLGAAPALPLRGRDSLAAAGDLSAGFLLPEIGDQRLSKPLADSGSERTSQGTGLPASPERAGRRWRRLVHNSKTLHCWNGRKGGALPKRGSGARRVGDRRHGAEQHPAEAWALSLAAERVLRG